MSGHIQPTPAQGAAYFGRPSQGPVVMLNLLRFRAQADYEASPDLAPAGPISGEEAYRRYASAVMPLLEKAGSEVIFQGTAAAFLIGPTDERWDLALLVRHQSAQAFLAFARDPDYLAVAGHRTAALEDSRLLPITATSSTAP